MATAQARAMFEQTGKKAVFGDPRTRQTYWSEVFLHNPHIMQPGQTGEALWIENYPGRRPYLMGVYDRRLIFNPSHKAPIGGICFSDSETAWRMCKDLPERFVVVEPNIKGKVSGKNKQWPWERWQAFVSNLCEHVVQLGAPGSKRLDRVNYIETPSFRHACAVLDGAAHFYGTDGGLHHAAAALGVPATVIWGGFSPPEVLGYDGHTNLGGGWCGALDDCEHCRREMEVIELL